MCVPERLGGRAAEADEIEDFLDEFLHVTGRRAARHQLANLVLQVIRTI